MSVVKDSSECKRRSNRIKGRETTTFLRSLFHKKSKHEPQENLIAESVPSNPNTQSILHDNHTECSATLETTAQTTIETSICSKVTELTILTTTSSQTSSPAFSPGISEPEPVVLTEGTEVSAKYKGAFCEAKIKNVSRMVKCRVSFKGPGSSVVVAEDNIKGHLRVGGAVEVKHNSNYVEATIAKIMDGSQYTVVFDDGDVTTLKRTSLCLKSGKHYSESESLDHLPLTNPEHFGNPVRGGRGKRKRHTLNSAASPGSNQPSYPCSDADDDDSAEGGTVSGSIDDDDDCASNLTQQSISKDKDDDTRSPDQKDESDSVGKVYVIEYGEKRGSKAKDTWYPALVVSPTTPENNTVKSLDSENEFLIKSFKDNKFYAVLRKDVKEFDRALYCSSLTDSNSSAALRAAVDKTITYLEKQELPNQWDSDLLLQPFKADDGQETGITSELDSAADDDFEEYKDDQPSEEKDRFVAQLYKFMDERGTPINRVPTVNGKELDLYRLHRLVNKMGGYNKITSKDTWRTVYVRAELPSCSTDNQENIAVNQLKAAYKKYLLNFTDFYRKLGYSTSFVSSPIASRTSSRPSRNERNWRTSASEASKETPVKTKRRKSVTEVTEVKPVVEESPPVIPPSIPEETEEVKVEPEDESLRTSLRRSSIKGKRDKSKPVLPSSNRKKGSKSETNEEEGAPDEQALETNEPEVSSDAPWMINCIGNDVEVTTGDKIRVKYFRGRETDIYEAKVLKTDKSTDPEKQRFQVHYAGWNTRYDEWIKRNRIVEVVRDKNIKRRGGYSNRTPSKAPGEAFEHPTEPPCGEEPPSPAKRGHRPAPVTSTARVSSESISSASTAKSIPVKAAPKFAPTSKKTRGKTDPDLEELDSRVTEDNEVEEKVEIPLLEAKVPPLTIISRRISTESDSRKVQHHIETVAAKDEIKETGEVSSDEETWTTGTSRRRNRRETKKSRIETETTVSSKRRAESPETVATTVAAEVSSVKKSKHSKRFKEEAKVDEETSAAASVPPSSSEPISFKDEPQKQSLSSTGKKRKADLVTPTASQEVSLEEPVTESEGKYSKRKRRLSSSKDKDQSVAASKVPLTETTKKKSRKDDFDRKKDDEEVNEELAKLFDEQKGQPEKTSSSEGSAPTFLLCSEEVPMSPAAVSASQTDTEAKTSKTDKEDKTSKGKSGEEGNFSPPTTPESLKSGTLSSLTPPHDVTEDASHHKSSQNNSSSNSDGEVSDRKDHNPASSSKHAYRPQSPQQHHSDDSSSRGPHDTSTAETKDKPGKESSPKRKRRGGRTRTASTCEANDEPKCKPGHSGHKNDKHGGYKTRGASAAKRGHRNEHDRYSPLGSDHLGSHPISPVSGISVTNFAPNAFFANIHPTSKYNFCTPLDEDLDAERRIQILNDRISQLRNIYLNLRSEMHSLERRRKKSHRRKERRSSASSPNQNNNEHARTSSTSSHHHHKQLDRSISGEQSSDTNDCFQKNLASSSQ